MTLLDQLRQRRDPARQAAELILTRAADERRDLNANELAKHRSPGASMTPGGHRVLIVAHRLGRGQINASDQLTIELVQTSETPTVIMIRWPDQPTVSPPSRFDATAAAVMRVLAAARVTLAQMKAGERRQTTD